MYFAGSVQARGTKVRPHLLRAIRSNDPALKAIAFLQREPGFVWRGKSRQYKQGKYNKGSNGDRCDGFDHLVPNSMRQRGPRLIVPVLVSFSVVRRSTASLCCLRLAVDHLGQRQRSENSDRREGRGAAEGGGTLENARVPVRLVSERHH